MFQNSTDTQALSIFIEHLKANNTLGTIIVANAGYRSESNHRFLEDDFDQHTAVIHYGTMLKENSRKWKSDDHKVMNWDYDEKNKNRQLMASTLTPKENWKYFKAKQRSLLSVPENAQIYTEPVFVKMKASLRFNRFSVRGVEKVTRGNWHRRHGNKHHETGHIRGQLKKSKT